MWHWLTLCADVTKSPYAIVEDEAKSPRIDEEDEDSSAEEPDDLPGNVNSRDAFATRTNF